MRESITPFESYSSCIKQETSSELPFTEKFIQVMEKIEGDHTITKDLVLELMQLFYHDNPLFLHLFQTSFLLLFKTYAHEGPKFNRQEGQSIIKKYSDLLKLFLVQMINMELEVKKSSDEQQYFQNFFDFYLLFFAEGLVSPKSFVKEFSFNILTVSFKIINEILDVELLPQTENQLVQSCIYLLGSNFEDYKKMGVQLYAILKKIKIASTQIQELLFEIIESKSNFFLRRLTILEGITIDRDFSINRLLNRLKDRNPLIVQTVIQKLIKEKIRFESLNYENRIKVLFNSICSHHVKVRSKGFQLLGLSLLRFLGSNRIKKQELTQNQFQQQGVDSFLNLFNSDEFQSQIRETQNHNYAIWSMCLKSTSLVCLMISPQLIKIQIKSLFKKMENLSITSKQSAFLFSILKQISLEQTQKINIIDDNKVQLKKFINSSDFLPSFSVLINKIKKDLKFEESQKQILKYGILLKIVQVLIKNFDITDCAGKRIVQQQLKKLILQFDYTKKKVQRNDENEKQNQNIHESILLERQLRKLNLLLNEKEDLQCFSLPVIIHPFDLLSIAVEVMLNLSQNQLKDSILQLKIHVNELLNNKQLALQRDINTKILLNTCIEISKAQQGSYETKPLQHLLVIKTQLQKRLTQNKKKVNLNIVKAFTLLVRILSFQQKNCQHNKGLIKASQYIENVKNYLYNKEDEAVSQKGNKDIQSLFYNFLPYVLIFYYCRQSFENYRSFKKLFFYYGLEQDQTVLRENKKSMLTKLINLRLLIELQLQYQNTQIIQQGEKQNHNVMCEFFQTILSMGLKLKEKTLINQLQETLYQQILVKILNSSLNYAKNKRFLTSLILIAIKQHFEKQSNHLLIRQILITFEQISTQHSIELFETIVSIYQSFIIYFEQNNDDQIEKQSISLFLMDITKIFLTLFKITNNQNTKNQHQSTQYLNISLIRLIKLLNLFIRIFQKSSSVNIIKTLRIKHIFPLFFSYNQDIKHKLNQTLLHTQQVMTQVLVFTKRKVQESLDIFTKKQIHNKRKQYLMFISDVQQIDQILQQEISKRLEEKSNQYDQQSTDNSPNQHSQNQQSITHKISITLIQSYEQNLNKQLKQQNNETKNLIKYIQKTNLLQKVLLKWKQSQQKSYSIQTNNNANLEQSKINDSLPEVSIQNQKQDLFQIFDRRGKRKDKISSQKIKVECYEVKPSVKKNRYLIIPYQIIQKAQTNSKKLKNNQKTLKQKNQISSKYPNSTTYAKIQNDQIENQ